MPEPLHNPRCHARHVGTAWAIEPAFFTHTVAAIRAGMLRPRELAAWDDEGPVPEPERAPPAPKKPYAVTPAGIAVIPLQGSMMKGWSKFAEVNTQEVRRVVRAAAADEAVRGILLHVDSPGGAVSGTQELADEIWAARQKKPVEAHVDDTCASAAYWVAAQAERLSVNAMGRVGSIGIYAVLEDTSKAADMAGVKVHVISTGELKGAYVEGAPIPEALLAEVQSYVDTCNEAFLGAIERGRGTKGLAGKPLRELADGRMFVSSDALKLGLVDAVESLEASHEVLARRVESAAAAARAGAARAHLARTRR